MLSWIRGKGRRTITASRWDIAHPLLHLSKQDVWTLGKSMENALVLGTTGSGKTSGSGAAKATAFLKAGYGGLVLCAKPEEMLLWQRYCARTNRTADLRIIAPEGPWRFNPLAYELARGGPRNAENVVGLLAALLDLADRDGSGGGNRDDESYWRRATRQLVRNLVELLILATGTVSVDALYRAAISAPQSMEEVRSEKWRASSFCFMLLRDADRRTKTPSQERDFALVTDYLLVEFPNLSSKTRSVILSCFTSQIDVMQRGVLRDLFGSDTTLTPDESERGAIIVVGLPVKSHREVGVIANVLLKYSWQRSIESRNVLESERPVFLWADEFQHFVTAHDAQFLATSRSARASTVLLTQNLPGVYAALGGGDKGRNAADAIFANCNLKVMHANSDPTTNEWCSSLIGRSRQYMANGNSSCAASGPWGTLLGAEFTGRDGTTSAGFSETMDFEVQPREFTRLRTGGPSNDWCVDSIAFQNGAVFNASGRNWLRTTFRQQP